MSLGALSRYDDAEDEIKDEDHDLVVQTKKSLEEIRGANLSSRPSSDVESVGSNKPKGLVSYIGGDYTDDDESDDEKSDAKPTIINLGLHEGSNQVSSVGSGSPASGTDGTEAATETMKKEYYTGVSLPPAPEGRCSKSLQERIIKMFDKKNDGMDVNRYLQNKKEFRNPSIYEKLITFLGIDEHGTNFPKHIYDPSVWGPESYYDALTKAQREYSEKKEKEKRESSRAKVEFVTGTKKPPSSAASASAAVVPPEKKSKWDQGPGKK